MRRRFLLVHNRSAGRPTTRLLGQVVAELERRRRLVTRWEPGCTIDIETVLGWQDYDAVISAGGDGTFRWLLKILASRDVPVGVVPMGTGNVLANEIGMPATPSALADVLIAGPELTLQAALANGEPFFLMAGAGFDGDVVRRLDSNLKQRVGKLSFVLPVLKALAVRPTEIEVEIDGETFTAGWVVASRARCYGGRFVIAPDASLKSRGMQVVLFRSLSRLVRLRQLLSLVAGRLDREPSVETVYGRHIRIRSAAQVPVQLDGDAAGTTPVEITLTGPRARLIVPRRFLA